MSFDLRCSVTQRDQDRGNGWRRHIEQSKGLRVSIRRNEQHQRVRVGNGILATTQALPRTTGSQDVEDGHSRYAHQ